MGKATPAHAVISEQEASTRKATLHPTVTAARVKTWHFATFASTAAAVTFINEAPAQVAGEISTTARNDGTVGLFYFL